uniref:Guanylate cyclase domain-containing protein n=1 Tax=viral metagenome TaxID=1070528 RepID=A0A6C0JYM8_9ZZZZ
MNTLLNVFLFTICYCQSETFLKICLYDKYELFKQDPILFFPVMQSANIFILTIFSLFTIHLLFFSKIKNYTIYSLAFVYSKYVMDNISNNIISIHHYEFRRTIMWLFTTPLILKMYCHMNNCNLIDINAQYHVISNVLHIVLYPFRRTNYNTYIIITLSVFELYFIYNLFSLKEQKYTQFIIYIWCLFSIITMIELINIFSTHDIQICYLLSDMIAKLTTILIVNDYEEQMYHIRTNVDLQSISLFTAIKKSIINFENTTNITPKCKTIIKKITNDLITFIPRDKTPLKLELLKKILPLELEENYLSQSKEYKPYDFVCVLFTDIVSYTELAKQYDADVIYKLLNDVYTRFDDIVNHYTNLQKIETIGDAYMVVGDIYTNDKTNHVKNIILLAIDFLKEIKKIVTPNNIPLQLRIGINIGKVVVGILGIEIPRLCVIGNTVNVANRLQTTADPDTIQISRHIYELAESHDFGVNINFELKENVFLKNIGITNTYIISIPN